MASFNWKRCGVVASGSVVALLGKSAPALAFCATCYTDAIGPKALEALKSGILILLLPTVVIFSGLMWVTFRYRNNYSWWQTSLVEPPECMEPPLTSAHSEGIPTSIR